MKTGQIATLVVLCCVGLILSGCTSLVAGSASPASEAPQGIDPTEGSELSAPPAPSSRPVTVGVLGSISGPNAASYPSFRLGIDARLDAYRNAGGLCAADGFTVVEADDMSSEQGALLAAQSLVQNNNVDAVLQASTVLAAALDFLTSQGSLPVLGYPLDGPSPQWFTADNNLFGVVSVPEAGAAYATNGRFLADQGATRVAGVSFDIYPAQIGLQASLESVEAAGLETVLTYDSLSLAAADLDAVVSSIMDSGADGLVTSLTPDVASQLVAELRQSGWDGVTLLPTGYGDDLLRDPEQREALQGVSFNVATAPVELQSEATRALADALSAAGSDSTVPAFFEIAGYLSADLLLYAFEQAGCGAASEELVATLREDPGYDAGGLLPEAIVFSAPVPERQCQYFVTLEGDAFEPVSEEPTCGEMIN